MKIGDKIVIPSVKDLHLIGGITTITAVDGAYVATAALDGEWFHTSVVREEDHTSDAYVGYDWDDNDGDTDPPF